jgi:hypothetical protein
MMNYADVLASPREQAARINTFLGRGLDLDRMAAVAEPSLYRNRRSSPDGPQRHRDTEKNNKPS